MQQILKGGKLSAINQKRIIKAIKQEATGLFFIFPAVALLGVFVLWPILRNFYLSFFSWDMITSDPVFKGWENYQYLFTDSELYKSLGNTLQYTAIIIPTVLLIGFVLGIIMSNNSKVNVIYRAIFFSPRVTSMVAISAVWLFIYHPQYGLLNQILGLMGIAPIRWLNDVSTALPSVAIITIWKSLGYCAIVFLGGIQNISKEVIEAAKVDGANEWQVTWRIRFPLVSPTTFMLLILVTIDTLKLYTTINVMTGGGPAKSTQNLVVMLYDYAFSSHEIGMASAISIILLVLILVINLIQMCFEKFVFYDS